MTKARWALITGASSGIGWELAKLFAADRWNLVLVARREERLAALASELKAMHGVESKILAVDLAKPAASREIFAACDGLTVSAVVNNAGFGYRAPFVDEELAASVEMMQVNMRALVELTRLFAELMVKRCDGYILNLASTAAFQPGPFTAMYYATKTFVLSFSIALGEELKGTGVSVTALCPGFTKTEFQFRSKMEHSSAWMPCMKADMVARIGYRGMLRRKRVVVTGITNRIGAAISSRLPATFTARIVRRINGY